MDKILIVEDEESILLSLEDDLRLEGYEVSSAPDGEKGLAAAKEMKKATASPTTRFCRLTARRSLTANSAGMVTGPQRTA